MKKKIFKIITVVIISIALLWAVGYILGTQSESYKFGVKFIDNNPKIINIIGPLKSKRLGFFGYSFRYRGPHGYAEYKIIVKGEKGNGAVYLNLEKPVGVWEVVKGNLILNSGESIPLSF
jgi:hypothetical protein